MKKFSMFLFTVLLLSISCADYIIYSSATKYKFIIIFVGGLVDAFILIYMSYTIQSISNLEKQRRVIIEILNRTDRKD